MAPVTQSNPLLTSARAFGHYIEQPNLIRKIAVGTGVAGLAGMGALVANDIAKAQPGEARQKIIIRDAVVLSATGLGTILATKRWMPLPSKEAALAGVAQLGHKLQEYGHKYADLLKLDAFANGKAQISREEFGKIVTAVKERGGKEELNDLLPVGGDMTEVKGFRNQVRDMARRTGQKDSAGNLMEDDGELVTMARFFTVGLASVLSGLTGGIVANKINKVKDPNATANMAKEGCFQFIANIALCAVGASIALVLMKIPQVAKQIAKLGALSKVVRTIGIMIGLCLGIFGGGIIANILGQRYINPLIDRLNGKQPDPNASQGGKRKIEFADAILHLDDLPTALAIAGFEAVEPILPWFFAFSGYRTGIGYRNDADSKHKTPSAELLTLPSAIPNGPTLGSTALNNASPFMPESNPAMAATFAAPVMNSRPASPVINAALPSFPSPFISSLPQQPLPAPPELMQLNGF